MAPTQDWNRRAQASEFVGRFLDWRWLTLHVPSIVGSADRVFVFPMVDRDPLPRWTHGRATLLGDAAHPMYPIGSNGATQGIIDARGLAFHLANRSDVDAALEAYEAERREATARIVQNRPADALVVVI
jgi:2-polyprenyl-6-methoxyphenol hydroxylase-like FAD-dependent oxidoreductase